MKKYEITDFDFCVEEEDVADVVLELSDLVSSSPSCQNIIVDGSIFDDFEAYSIIKIMFADYEEDTVFEYQMTYQDPETKNITMDQFDYYSIESAMENLNNELRRQFVGMTVEVPDDAYDDIEGYVSEQISEKTGWLVNTFNADLVEEKDYTSTVLNVEVCSDGIIYISHNGSSGAKYEGSTPADIGFAVQCYMEDYFE